MEIHLKVRRQKLMTADAVQRKLQSGFIFHIVSLNVLLKFIDIVNWLGTVKTFSRNHFAVLQFMFGEDFFRREKKIVKNVKMLKSLNI